MKRYVYCVIDKASDEIEAVLLSRAEGRLWLKITAPAFPHQAFRIERARLTRLGK